MIEDEVKEAKLKLAKLDSEIGPLKSSIEARKKSANSYFNFKLGFNKKKPEDDKEKSKEDLILEKDETLLEKLNEAKSSVSAIAEKPPRTFILAKEFYNMRLSSKRQAQITKQTQQKMEQPDFFPKPPSHTPS